MAESMGSGDGPGAVEAYTYNFYTDETFQLPVRLGLLNSRGQQDLIVHVLAGARYEVANYENVFLPTNLTVHPRALDRFGGFYLTDSGHDVPVRVDDAREVAAIMAARRRLGAEAALLVSNPLPIDRQVDPALHDHLVADAEDAAAAAGLRGKDVTPFLLGWFHERSEGESLRANTEIIVGNAALAARIAVADAA